METKGRYDSIIAVLTVLGVTAALISLLAMVAAWLVGSPVQAAALSPDPTPTAHRPSGTVPPIAAPPLPPTPTPRTAAPATVVAGTDGVNVRSGPGTDFDKVGYLNPSAAAPVTGRSGDWWQIDYGGDPAWVAAWVVTAANAGHVPEVAPPPTPVPASSADVQPPGNSEEIDEGQWIDVDLSDQVLTAYENDEPVHTTLVSTGLPQTPTPTGRFRIWIKLSADDMAGADYYIEDVPFVMYFHQGYGLHGVTWHGNFGHPMSHGCVNLPTPEAEWLFNWAEVGTLVNIHN